ncbi:MAG TPA: DNA repair protein RecN [Actinomycetota bacterium]|nr:DNA repair protein RecN [Actinomycetota bacterium]
MLRELHISGLGVIDDLELELDPGLNVLTGETGAGKTLITVGLALVLGRRSSASQVRSGAKAAKVQARFDASERAIEEGWADDDEVLLSRSVSADGRSTARIGDQLGPVSALAAIADGLVEFHGQHENAALRSAAAQARFLDRWSGPAHAKAVAALRKEHERLRRAREALEELAERERDRQRELDLLDHQVREIEGVGPRVGELEELTLEEARLSHGERLLELAVAVETALAADDGAADALASAASGMRAIAELDGRTDGLAARVADLAASAVELGRDVRAYREGLELDPDRLEVVRERIGALQALRRRYGAGEEEVLAYLEQAKRRLAELAGAEAERGRLEDEVRTGAERSSALAERVSEGRRASAPRLARALAAELQELGMEGAGVEIGLLPFGEIGPGGAERVELRLSGGPGQAALPLSNVASGGELSRTMLACRSVLVDLDDVPTLVFDEVDAGIGGFAGVAVGRRLAALAATRQVLVVTHLPQIASFADRHVRVEKHDGVAVATVLDDAGRVEELTRMLSGRPDSEAAATHAEELLAQAGRSKPAR